MNKLTLFLAALLVTCFISISNGQSFHIRHDGMPSDVYQHLKKLEHRETNAMIARSRVIREARYQQMLRNAAMQRYINSTRYITIGVVYRGYRPYNYTPNRRGVYGAYGYCY